MRQITLIGQFLFLLTVFSFGQDDPKEKNPIDIRLEKCMSIDSNMSTAGMNNCVNIATDEWDKEMNKYYKLLMDSLNVDEKSKLKEAQRQWLIYRDKELIFSYEMYGNKDGTMWTNVSTGRHLDIIKQRAIELKVYYELHKFQ